MKDKILHKLNLIHPLKVRDERGTLSVLEIGKFLDLPIAELCWIDNLFQSASYPDNPSVIVNLAGSVDVKYKGNEYSLLHKFDAIHISDSAEEDQVAVEVMTEDTDALFLYTSSSRSDIRLKVTGNEKQFNMLADCTVLDFHAIAKRVISVRVGVDVPFQINRVFYIYDIPEGMERGMHAHKDCHTLLIPIQGSFDVELDDGTDRTIMTLDDRRRGLHIPPGIWSVQKNYSPDVRYLVLASHEYNTEEYINSYEEFKKYRER